MSIKYGKKWILWKIIKILKGTEMVINFLICSAKCMKKCVGCFMNNKDSKDKIENFQPKTGELVCYAIVIFISVVFRLLKLSAWYILILLPAIFVIRLYYTHFHRKRK